MKKILQLSTYPIMEPLHGGQIRVSQIRKFFEDENCIVRSLSLSEKTHGHYDPENDFLIDGNELYSLVNVHFCADYATSLLSVKGEAFEFLKERIIDFKPDIILVEQVWLWPAVKKLIHENYLPRKTKVIYSSQNIEYQTKKSLLESHNMSGMKENEVINGIHELEKDICEQADYVIACTKIDGNTFSSMGAKETIICRNGVKRRRIDPKVSEDLKIDLNGRKYALFVGSAYPPNAQGFWEMLGESMAWLPPEYIIIAAGGVSSILENYMPESAKLYSNVSFSRIKRVGFVTEELLASLLDNASVILLPITVGGGSNLKTAEAIASGKPVIATPKACRGFNFVNNLSNFTITNQQQEFIARTSYYLTVDSTTKIMNEHHLRESVYWSICLEPLNLILEKRDISMMEG